MRIGMEKPDWAYIGACLARGDDGDQIKFFKALVRECKTWGTQYQIEYQLAAVNQELTSDEKEILSMLGHKEEV